MRSLCLILFFSVSAYLQADSLKDLYDPNKQVDRNKTSSLAQREFKAQNFTFNRSSLLFKKSLSMDQTAKSKRLTWNQTAYFADKKFEKTLPRSLWGSQANSMVLPTFAWQDKSVDHQKPFGVDSSSAFTFQEARGFSGKYPVKDYRGDLPVNVSRSLQDKKEKTLTIEEIKEILNRNK